MTPERLSRACLVCGLPLSGALASVLSLAGVRRSSRNPNCCTRCNVHIEEGRLVELTMVFADLSSFTELTARLGAESTYEVVDNYLRAAAGVLTAHGAFIDKYIGDCVMAFFNAPVKREDHAAAAVEAARGLQLRLPALSKELGHELRASVGIATGYARVGRLGSDDVKDYTAIGDVVNQAARLQAQARAGEILVAENVYARVAGRYPGVPREVLVLKGFREPSAAYRLKADGTAGFALWLDHSPLRLPLLVAAAAAAAASLALAAREHAQRRALELKHGCVVVTPSEKRRNLLVAALSFAALLFVGMELALHSPEGAEFRRSIDLRAPGER